MQEGMGNDVTNSIWEKLALSCGLVGRQREQNKPSMCGS